MMLGAGAATVGGVAYTRSRRAKLYRELAERVVAITSTHALDMGPAQRRPLPGFADRLAIVPDFLPPHTFAALRAEAERLASPERNYVPAHKKGGTVAYETLIDTAPGIVSFYHSAVLLGLVSRLVGVWVGPTPIYDQSSLSLLFYNKPGDHIGWHYDHNFYRGRHFTLLLAIVNTGAGGARPEPCRPQGAGRRAGDRDQHRPQHARRIRRRIGAASGDADSRRRAARHSQHDLLHRSAGALVAGGVAANQGHGLLRRPGALDLTRGPDLQFTGNDSPGLPAARSDRTEHGCYSRGLTSRSLMAHAGDRFHRFPSDFGTTTSDSP